MTDIWMALLCRLFLLDFLIYSTLDYEPPISLKSLKIG